MDIEKLKDLPEEDRLSTLDSNALTVEEGKYEKPLSPEELLYYKDQLADDSIQQAIILDEFQRVKESFKERLKPIKQRIGESLSAVKFKSIQKEGKIWKLADFDDHMIHKVDQAGNIISSRKMLPEERQCRILSLKQQSA